LVPNIWFINCAGNSLATLKNASVVSLESSPSILASTSLFYKLLPPIFFKAFKAASRTALSGLSLNIYPNLAVSIPLYPPNSYCMNYLLNLLFLSSNNAASYGASIPYSALAKFLIISAELGSFKSYRSF
jgi:hypothetical protein